MDNISGDLFYLLYSLFVVFITLITRMIFRKKIFRISVASIVSEISFYIFCILFVYKKDADHFMMYIVLEFILSISVAFGISYLVTSVLDSRNQFKDGFVSKKDK